MYITKGKKNIFSKLQDIFQGRVGNKKLNTSPKINTDF